MSVARFIADQRTYWKVPVGVCCALLGVSVWDYKWWRRTRDVGPHTPQAEHRVEVDRAVAAAFTTARGLHGSPRLVHDLREAGWIV